MDPRWTRIGLAIALPRLGNPLLPLAHCVEGLGPLSVLAVASPVHRTATCNLLRAASQPSAGCTSTPGAPHCLAPHTKPTGCPGLLGLSWVTGYCPGLYRATDPTHNLQITLPSPHTPALQSLQPQSMATSNRQQHWFLCPPTSPCSEGLKYICQ